MSAMVSLKDCVEILDSKRRPVNKKERKNRICGKPASVLYPYYGAVGQAGLIDDYIFDGSYVLLGEDGAPFFDPTRETAYMVSGRFWANNHIHVLKPVRDVILPQYLCFYLNHIDYTYLVTGTTRLKLNISRLKEIMVPVPGLKEQQETVDRLHKAFNIINENLTRLQHTRNLIKTYRDSVIRYGTAGRLGNYKNLGKRDWKSVKFGDVISLKVGKAVPVDLAEGTGKYPVYGGNGISGYCSGFMFEESKIIMGRVGNNCGVVIETMPMCWITDNALIADSVHIHKKFLYYLLNSFDFKYMCQSTAQQVISRDRVYNINLSIPPIEVQEEIAHMIEGKLDFAQKAWDKVNDCIDSVWILKKSILKKEFDCI